MICECLWQSPSCDQILPFVHLNTKLLAVFYLRLVPEKPVKSCQILCLVWFWLILFSAGRFAWLTSILLPNSLSSKPRIYEAGFWSSTQYMLTRSSWYHIFTFFLPFHAQRLSNLKIYVIVTFVITTINIIINRICTMPQGERNMFLRISVKERFEISKTVAFQDLSLWLAVSCECEPWSLSAFTKFLVLCITNKIAKRG